MSLLKRSPRTWFWAITALLLIVIAIVVGNSSLFRGFLGGKFSSNIVITDIKNKDVSGLKSVLFASNQKILELNKQYLTTTEKDRRRTVLQKFIAEAKSRKKIMAKLMSVNPAEANQLVFPKNLLEQFPMEVQSFIERTEELEGILVEQHTDLVENNKIKSTPTSYFLRLNEKKQIQLFFQQTPKDLERGMRFKARGIFLNGIGFAVLQHSILSRPALSRIATTLTLRPTQKKMGVVLVKFADQPGIEASYPNAVSTLQARFFESDPSVGISSLKHFFLTTSYGKALITGSAAGWIQLPETANYYYENYGECLADTGFFQAVVDTADPSMDWSNTDLLSVVYFNPAGRGCSTRAITTGDDEKIEFSSNEGTFRAGVTLFQNYLPVIAIIIHEIGHNYGLQHAQGWDCPGNVGADLRNPEASPCSVVPYGDDDDMMGAYTDVFLPSFLHFSAARKEQLGWLTSAQTQIINETGDYVLKALEPPDGIVKQLKIYLGNIGFYSIEYRQSLVSSSLSRDGVIVRFVPQHLLSGYAGRDYSLRPGIPWNPENSLTDTDQLFTDPYRGINIRLIAKTGSRATVHIEIEKCDDIDNTGEGTVDEGCDDDNDSYCDGFMTVIGTPSTCTAGGNDINDGDPAATIIPVACATPENTCPPCVDSDGGTRGTIGGSVVVTSSTGLITVYPDSCISGTTVREEFCPPPYRGWAELFCGSDQVCVDPDGSGATPAYCGTP